MLTNLKADFLVLLGAASWAIFAVLGKKHHYDRFFSMMFYFLFAFIIIIFATFLFSSFKLPTLRELGILLYLGIVTKGIAFGFYFKAMELGDSAEIANMSYLTPFLALGLNNLFLGDVIHWYYLIALVLIMGGIVIQRRNLAK